MKIRFFPADLDSAGYYRILNPARVAKANGLDVVVHNEFKVKGEMINGRFRVKIMEELDCDVVVIQRPLAYFFRDVIPLIQAQGIRVIADTDDDSSALTPDNPNWAQYNSPESLYHWKYLFHNLSLCDEVTVSCDTLQKIHGGVVIPNCIPEDKLVTNLTRNRDLGWAGGAVHAGDFRECGGEIAKIINTRNIPFHFFGQKAPEAEKELGIPGHLIHHPPVAPGEHFDFPFGVGIIPLKDSRFNRSRSWLKALEYSARGIPFVASDMPAYRAWKEESGAPFVLAHKPNRWKAINHLLDDDDLYDEIQGINYEAAERWTFENQFDRWADVWSGDRQHGKKELHSVSY